MSGDPRRARRGDAPAPFPVPNSGTADVRHEPDRVGDAHLAAVGSELPVHLVG